jgi:hypothetical protein
MSRAHKNECPGGAGQVVNLFAKYATDFIGIAARITSADTGLYLLFVVLLIQAVLTRLWGIL